jgi:hypothetical protein
MSERAAPLLGFGLLAGGKRDGGWDGAMGVAPALAPTVLVFLDEPAAIQ